MNLGPLAPLANAVTHVPHLPPALVAAGAGFLKVAGMVVAGGLVIGFLKLLKVCRSPLGTLPFGQVEGDVLFVGPRGSGKSHLAMRLCIEDCDDHVATNASIDADRLAAILAERGEDAKEVRTVEHPREFLDYKCGIRWLDEAQQYFPARGYKDIDPVAVKAVFEQRKDDGRTVYTAQALRHFDVQPASFCDYVVRVNKIRRLPCIGWPFMRPDCVRPTLTCRWSVDAGKPHTKRDGAGDQETWFDRLLGMGSVLSWSVVNPELIVQGRTIEGTADPEDDPAVISTGRAFFSNAIANCYDSGQKVNVKSAPRERKRSRGRRNGAPPAEPAGGAPLPATDPVTGTAPIPF